MRRVCHEHQGPLRPRHTAAARPSSGDSPARCRASPMAARCDGCGSAAPIPASAAAAVPITRPARCGPSLCRARSPARSLAEARAWQRAAAPDRRSSWRVVRGGGDERYDALMGRLYREFATASDARVVVDASKQPADALVAGRSGAEAYVLHLVRDPRGVAYSLAKRSEAHAAAVVKASALWTGATWRRRSCAARRSQPFPGGALRGRDGGPAGRVVPHRRVRR